MRRGGVAVADWSRAAGLIQETRFLEHLGIPNSLPGAKPGREFVNF